MKNTTPAFSLLKPLRSIATGSNHFLCCCILLCCFSGISFVSNSQCLTVPAPLSCPIAGAIALTDNTTLTAGNTYTLTGTSSFTNITMNGGTLVVCGTLNLANFTFNSGTIYVASGGSLNVNTSASIVFGSNSNIYNFGSVYFASSIVTGTNNIIYNCLISSYFNIPFNQLVIQGPNTYFINNGIFNSSYFIVQSNNSANVICSGTGSVITTGIMINQFANAFNSPNGPSCIQITNTIINSQPMTTSPNVDICYVAATVSVVSGPGFGSATVNNNCTSCSIPLPVGIITSSATCYDLKLHVNWTVDSETDCAEYHVQRSDDGIHFNDALAVACQGTSPAPTEYSVELPSGFTAKQEYVRLKRTEMNGNAAVSNTMVVDCSLGLTIDIYPTMVTTPYVTVNSDKPITSIALYGMDGKLVQTFEVGDKKEVVIEIGSQVAIGQYMLTVKTDMTRVDKLLRVVR